MKIIFKSEFFVAVDKSAGVLSVPARTADDPRPILGKMLQEELQTQIYPIHRLDAEVSGLVLYALDPEAHAAASLEFEHRRVKKTYQAFSQGASFGIGQSGKWTAQILRGKKRAYESPHGKQAITLFEVIGEKNGIYEWRLFPQTGRSHQLRWEMYRHESPILGDSLYGSTFVSSLGIGLRSLSLDFTADFSKQFGLPGRLALDPWSTFPG